MTLLSLTKFSLIKKLFAPKQIDEEKKHQELILNILLIFALFSFLFINIIQIVNYLINKGDAHYSLYITLIILGLFIIIFLLSRMGWIKIASLLFIITFALPMVYSFLTWGADLPAALILAVLVIVLNGVLLGTKPIFLSTIVISGFLILISHQQAQGSLPIENYWHNDPAQVTDAITHSFLLLIIAGVAWISCRTINNSLRQARRSEKLLKEERDSLEIKVEERTRELLHLETEKIKQLYRFAEFGRLSSGIFHDLINPLSAVSLNLEQVKLEQIKTETDCKILNAKSYLSQALVATHKMEGLVASIKRQINRETSISLFSINQEIEQSLEILAYKARRARVDFKFENWPILELKGDALKFGQIITNILANAIEACEEVIIKEVHINLFNFQERIRIIITDSGVGITSDNLFKIFKPFFSTKKLEGQGLGIGLALTKEIIEKDFHGLITVTSQLGHGATFEINLPKKIT